PAIALSLLRRDDRTGDAEADVVGPQVGVAGVVCHGRAVEGAGTPRAAAPHRLAPPARPPTGRAQGRCPQRGDSASHNLTVWSSLPEAGVVPSRLKATEWPKSVCPRSVARSWPLAASHSLIVLSPSALARVLPSGL